jgi:hypothetical protein
VCAAFCRSVPLVRNIIIRTEPSGVIKVVLSRVVCHELLLAQQDTDGPISPGSLRSLSRTRIALYCRCI